MKKIFFAICLLAGLMNISSANAQSKKQAYNIVYIGNSITQGVLHEDRTKTAPPVFSAEMIEKALASEVNFRNVGRAGATTFDWLPESKRYFPLVEKAVAELKAENGDAHFVFPIMLGTNDSASKGPTGSPVSNADYKNNLLTIISRLREMCPESIFVLHRPIWYSPNTYNGARYLVAGLNRATEYITPLEELARENGDIYLGDCESYGLFKNEYKKYMFAEKGNAGTFYLHPNEEGAVELAENWAKAIAAAVKASAR